MSIQIGNAPCSWGVEFANDPRNPDWRSVLKDCADAGYGGIELGPVGFMPENPAQLTQFMEELLYINHHMFYGSFTVNMQEKVAAIGYKRLLEGANRVEMIEPIESIGYYAENLSNFLSEKYGLKKIEKN